VARELAVKIVGDSSSLERAFARSERSAKRFQSSMSRIGGRRGGRAGGLGGGLGLALSPRLLGLGGVTAGLKQSTEAASDFNEQVSKTEQVFGDSSKTVIEWSKTTTEAYKVSQREALTTASTIGALLAPLGIVGAAAARQSQRLTELGADLASFYNTNVQDAVDAIISGLTGQAEPLRRYGVLLTEARVQAEALRATGKKHTTQLTAQEKVQARIRLIYRDTKKAQGDVARTQGEAAGQTREFKARVDDLKVSLGEGLVPALTDAVTWTNNLINAFKNNKYLKIGNQSIIDIYKSVRHLGFEGKKVSGKTVDFFGIEQTFGGPRLNEAAKKVKKARDEIAKPPKRFTAQQNQWFDARIARRIDRLQDLSLRRQLARVKEITATVRARRDATKDITRRLTLEDQLVSLARERRSVEEQIAEKNREQTEAIKEANRALKDRAEAIKSAVIERLQRRQTDVLNRRALAEAQEQLRLARGIGGPQGIKLARQAVQDVRFDILRARLENAPARLTRGGQFAFGGVVINIHGVTDPEAVANRVAAVLKRRQRRTTTQARGNKAGV